jgi:xanthine/uracil permease
MKKILFTFLQFLLFLVVLIVGSFLHPFHLRWGVTVTASGATRYFVPDGLLLALALFVLIAAVQIVRKRLQAAAWTTVALILALVAGYAMSLGYITLER